MRGCLVFIGLTTLMMSAQAAGWQKSNCNAFDEAATAQANIMDPVSALGTLEFDPVIYL